MIEKAVQLAVWPLWFTSVWGHCWIRAWMEALEEIKR